MNTTLQFLRDFRVSWMNEQDITELICTEPTTVEIGLDELSSLLRLYSAESKQKCMM